MRSLWARVCEWSDSCHLDDVFVGVHVVERRAQPRGVEDVLQFERRRILEWGHASDCRTARRKGASTFLQRVERRSTVCYQSLMDPDDMVGDAVADAVEGAFDGVKVVELAQWVFVPVAGALLADWGADVIRIEKLEGDPYRGLASQGIGTDRGGVNLSMALANRGKRSIALDLQTDDGRAVLDELLDSADVFLTNLRPGALERLGLGAAEVRQRFPGLVYARGHGYGVRGPDADQAGYDASAFFARGGLAHVLTPKERDYPIQRRGAMGDRNGAMALAFGIAGALLRRHRTGTGSVVDVSLLATAMWTLSSDLLAALNGGEVRRGEGRGAFRIRSSAPTELPTADMSRSSSSNRTVTGRICAEPSAGTISWLIPVSSTMPPVPPMGTSASPRSMRSSGSGASARSPPR